LRLAITDNKWVGMKKMGTASTVWRLQPRHGFRAYFSFAFY